MSCLLGTVLQTCADPVYGWLGLKNVRSEEGASSTEHHGITDVEVQGRVCRSGFCIHSPAIPIVNNMAEHVNRTGGTTRITCCENWPLGRRCGAVRLLARRDSDKR